MRDTRVLICSMETSEQTPNIQVDSQEVSPTQKENLEPTRNRRANSRTSGQIPPAISVINEATTPEEGSSFNSNRKKPKSDPGGTKAIRSKPRTTSKNFRKVKTRPGVTQVAERSFITRIELPPGPDGKRRRKKFTSTTQQGVLDKRDEYITNLSRNIEPEGHTTKFKDFARMWLEEIAPRTCNPNTVNNYAICLRLHILPVIGNMRLTEFRGRHIDDVLAHMQYRGLSIHSRRAARRVMSTIFTQAVRRDLLDRNPVANSLPPKLAPGEFAKRRIVLSPDDTVKVLRHLNGKEDELLFKTYIFTGMRRGEVAGLTWGDICDNGRDLLITVTKQVKEVTRKSKDGKGSTVLEETPPKTINGNRAVNISRELYQDLMAYKHALGIRDENERVFRDSIGGQLWPSNITKRWKKIRKELGFDQVRLHDLRHSYAVNSLIGGAPLEALSDVMGHHSISVTKDIYAKSIPGSGAKVSDAFNSVIVPAVQFGALTERIKA